VAERDGGWQTGRLEAAAPLRIGSDSIAGRGGIGLCVLLGALSKGALDIMHEYGRCRKMGMHASIKPIIMLQKERGEVAHSAGVVYWSHIF
jgi:hypothetical protein